MRKLENSLIRSRKNVDDFWLKFWDLSAAKVCKSCRSHQELSNEYLLAKIGVDTAENEPLKVWRKIQFIIHSPPYSQAARHLPSRAPGAVPRLRCVFEARPPRLCDGRSAKFRQNVAGFRLYRHRFLQETTHFAAFFKIYQIIKLKFWNLSKFCSNLMIYKNLLNFHEICCFFKPIFC